MTSLFSRMVSLQDIKKRSEQFAIQAEKLESDYDAILADDQRNGKEQLTFQRRCADLHAQIQQFLQNVEDMRTDSKSSHFLDEKKYEVHRLNSFMTKLNKWLGKNHSFEKEQEAVNTEKNIAATIRPDVHSSSSENSTGEHVTEGRQGMVHHLLKTEQMEKSNDAPAEVSTIKKSVVKEVSDIGVKHFVAIADFNAQQDTDLSLKKGDIFTITGTRADGWWFAINGIGEKGLVPKTYLKAFVGISNEASAVREQAIPLEQHRTLQQRDNSVTSEQEMSLKEMPAGFFISDLARMHNEDLHLSYCCHLVPRLSQSNLGFHDLYWNDEVNKLRKRRIRVSKCMRLIKVENLPTGEIDGLQVNSRHVRLSLFDSTGSTGKQIVSNVHTIRAQYTPKESNKWTFLNKLDDCQNGLDFADFFVRSNYAQRDVVLLIEANISYFQPRSGKHGDLSLGWALLPLLNENTNQQLSNDQYVHFAPNVLQNKTYHINLKCGSPFETNTNIKDFVRGTNEKRPKVSIKVFAPESSLVKQLDCLPDVLIWNTLYTSFVFYYRHSAGQVLIKNRVDMQNAELVVDPFLALFPICADKPDIMDALRKYWLKRETQMSKSTKKSDSDMASEFRKAFLETGFALCPSVESVDREVKSDRQALPDSFNPLSFLANGTNHLPFDIFSPTFNLLGPHAID